MSWRLIDSDLRDPAYTAAADEAILLARNEGTVPNTLHFYRRSHPTVSLGHFEKAEERIDLDAVREEGVAVVRRMSGGSAVYTDQGQLVYSLIVRRADVPASAEGTFALACGALIRALVELGVQADFKPVNDVQVRGRKISGSAQVRRRDTVLVHGTLLVETDLKKMQRILRSPKRAEGGMTTLAAELGTAPPMDKVKRAVANGFSEAFGTAITRGEMTEKEGSLTAQLVREKYGTAEHTFRR